ncbi:MULTISPECIES: DMT family transporter [unclassified Janthinobacterium]|uniref:DMT family transporter n=1 Tax=unclassified Janthinobacterium TaxID=2610881 RepID=UPI000348376E|nr:MULTISPECIES: DMT family transporter [unclassified Janthinobacterium]MEC5162161.1 drug/metabolite transporter (DMT)-like permease [Janthinobacterium sp. CG_S6]
MSNTRAAHGGLSQRALPLALPGFFVLLWSTGFIVAKFGLPYAPPLTFLLLRFVGVLLILLPCVLLLKAPWPVGKMRHIAVAGLLLQAGYLTGVWCAIKLGMPAGLSALIVGMQPILTACAARLIGETVRPRQWLGLMFGLLGVALVVYAKINLVGLSMESVLLCVFALLSITAGTLYQKHNCPSFDLRSGTVIQFAASIVVVLPLAIWLEDLDLGFAAVQWTANFVGALLWSVLVLSIGAIFLLFALIRRSDATQVTSLLYLTPPTTAVMAWLMFGEAFNFMGIAGMVVAVVGVIFVAKK